MIARVPPADDEPRGYGARRGWRAPKGAGARRSRRARRGEDPARDGEPAADAPAPGSTAAHLAAALGLRGEDAARLAAEKLPPPGAPDALGAGIAAVGRLLRDARQDRDQAQRDADATADRRARDVERGRAAIERAQQREARQRQKATTEQGERQRLAGELERTTALLAQVSAERDRLREPPAGDTGDGADRDRAAEATAAGLAARVADLEAQLEARGRSLEELTDRVEASEAERERLLASARRLRRQALEAGAPDVDLVDPEDAAPLRIDDLPEVRSVLEAVELAAAHAEHLVYSERAFETARTAPYDEPRKLLRDLVALDRVAGAWNVAGGIGRPIRDVALQQQLEWADDVSVTARAQNAREYAFSHDGRPLWAGPHVRVATGRGMRRTCRVYLALVKGDEPDLAGLPRGIYVGPVGKHLSDSTTG